MSNVKYDSIQNDYTPMLWHFWSNGVRVYNPFLDETRTRAVDPCEHYGFVPDETGCKIFYKDCGDTFVYVAVGTSPLSSRKLPTEEDMRADLVNIGAWGPKRDEPNLQFIVHTLPNEEAIELFESTVPEVLADLQPTDSLTESYVRLLQAHAAAEQAAK